MHRLRRFRTDLLTLGLLTVLPLLWFSPVLFTGNTLLPYDNLYQFEPWRALQPDIAPHNGLLSDLVLENAVWKLHVSRTLGQGEFPLWNPQLFTGAPFFAAGQASVAYFLSVLFYLLPIEAAYGWFTAIQLAIAGINAYLLGRVLKLRSVAALFSGVAFQFSGFLIVSVVFSMVLAATAWLPLLLAIIERVIQKQEEKGIADFRPIPYVIAGGIVVGLVALAGHPEFFYYTLLVAGIYTAVRLLVAWRRIVARRGLDAEGLPVDGALQGDGVPSGGARPASAWGTVQGLRAVAMIGGWLLFLALVGVAFGAVQLLPLYELLQQNFREGSVSYRQVVSWAWPFRHILTFVLPDIFGNPSHHQWFDLWALRWQPTTVNRLGEANNTIFWGIKNYVEGGSYVGIGTWLLAALAVVAALGRAPAKIGSGASESEGGAPQRLRPGRAAPHALRTPTLIFAALALLSLLFAFGTPLYALLYYGLPGWDQLHSPFRWVFPFTLAIAVLGGIGLQQALTLRSLGSANWSIAIGRVRIPCLWLGANLSLLSIAAGCAAMLTVAASFFFPAPFVNLAQRVVESSDLAQLTFADGRMFWGYESVGLARFGIVAAVGGLFVWRILRGGQDAVRNGMATGDEGRASTFRARVARSLPYLLVILLFLDLYAVHGDFNPATDPALSPLKNVPPVVQFIDQKEDAASEAAIQYTPFRFTTFDRPGSKTFNANSGMYYGWQDLRGYDSIILKQYVGFMNRIADQSGELIYNRIAPLYAAASPANGGNPFAALENPLLDLLGVKYILSESVVPNADTWTKVYQDDTIRVYENLEVFPRSFIATEAVVLPADAQPLLEADLRRTVFIEEPPAAANALTASSPQVADTSISRYTANEVFVDVNLSDRGWLVLTDAYAPGWKAYLRPFGGVEGDEEELTIQRANSAFRTVYLPQSGQWTVRFIYSPMSFKLGLYISFLATMLSLLLLLWWVWGRFYSPDVTANEVRTVAKNSVAPMGLNLANQAINFAFAMLYVRLLGLEGTGKYAFVVVMYGFFEILSRYGLGTLLTREVAADKNQSSRYLTNVLALRTLLWGASLILMGLTAGGYWFNASIGREELQAIAVFALVMLVANWSDAFSSLFNAFEKMEYPASLGSAMALLKVTLGALALLLGWGIVGLAWVALVVNLVQLLWLIWLVRSTLFKPEWKWDWAMQRWMFKTSGSLMINHLLATIFWRMDIWMLRPLAGAASVGLYSASLKYLDGLNIIPSTFTLAIFPLMSRFARQEGAGLLRSYTLSVRLLLLISLPVAMTIAALAKPLIYLIGGANFLNASSPVPALAGDWCGAMAALWEALDCSALSFRGGAVLALQVIIWSIPVGFVNSVTQYALIAVDQQRYLTKAFILGVLFNLAGNLLLIPRFNYFGAAVVTILSEFCLLILFSQRVRGYVGAVSWLDLIWRPAISVVVMGGFLYALSTIGAGVWLTILPAWAVYVGVFAMLGGFENEELRAMGSALLHKRMAWTMQDGGETL